MLEGQAHRMLEGDLDVTRPREHTEAQAAACKGACEGAPGLARSMD